MKIYYIASSGVVVLDMDAVLDISWRADHFGSLNLRLKMTFMFVLGRRKLNMDRVSLAVSFEPPDDIFCSIKKQF